MYELLKNARDLAFDEFHNLVSLREKNEYYNHFKE